MTNYKKIPFSENIFQKPIDKREKMVYNVLTRGKPHSSRFKIKDRRHFIKYVLKVFEG